MSFLGELQRRNVFRVGIAYAIAVWVLLQITDVITPILALPDWAPKLIFVILAIGFVPAVIFAWAFEMTPEGLKKEKDVDRSNSITRSTGQKLNFVIIATLVLAVGFLFYDRTAVPPVPDSTPTNAPQSIDDPVVTAGRPSIAVLPFADMSPGKDQDYFSDGISEEILNLLAKITNLKVIARTSSFAFKGKNVDVRVIGDKLDVKMVLEGSVRQSGDRVRITAQLIDVTDGSHLWSDTYDRTLTDIFAVQDEVAAAIIDALQIHVGATPTRGRPTDNTEAYSLFLKAKSLAYSATPGDAVEEVLLRAIELDSEFAEAYELLARKHWNMSEQQQAAEAAGKALAINPDLVMAQAVYQSAKIGAHLAGIEAFEVALGKQPDDPLLLQALSWNLIQAGYFSESLSLAQHWVDVDPISAHAHGWLGVPLYAAGHIDESITAQENAIQLSSDPTDRWRSGDLLLLEMQDEQAIAHFETVLRQTDYPDSSWVRELVTHARDPASGQAYLDRRIPEIIAAMPEEAVLGIDDVQTVLRRWYLYFGFIDRYFELLLENDPNNARWTEADLYLFDGIIYRRTGFTAHPEFLEVAETMGLIKIWEKRGPPDFCDKIGGQWVCE